MIDKDNILYRIFSRIIIININGKEYIVKAPTAILRYQAEIYKQKVIEDYKYELPRLEFYEQYLIRAGFIERDYETKIKNMNDTIRRFKLELYQCGPRIEQEKKVRKNLEVMKKKLYDYCVDVDTYKKPSVEYFAEDLKNKYLLTQTTFYDDKLIFNLEDLDVGLLNCIVEKLNEEDVSIEKFRELARTEPWRNYWNVNKQNVFGISSINYSEEQKILCNFSRFYDSIFEHSDCPDDNVIEDCDKIDGWMIFQHEKNKKDRKPVLGSNIPEKFQEVYINAKSQQEANKIYAENSQDSKRILKERAAVLKGKEEVKDIQFVDTKLTILEERSKQESALMKRR